MPKLEWVAPRASSCQQCTGDYGRSTTTVRATHDQVSRYSHNVGEIHIVELAASQGQTTVAKAQVLDVDVAANTHPIMADKIVDLTAAPRAMTLWDRLTQSSASVGGAKIPRGVVDDFDAFLSYSARRR